MDYILYHDHCPDGFGAAFVAKGRFPEATIKGFDHGLEPPYDLVRGKDILVVDFSWRTREANLELAHLAKSFHILDHHKTAQASLEGLDFAIFDMERSGIGLAWDYLFGKDSKDDYGYLVFNDGIRVDPLKSFVFSKPRPWWVDYIEDRDLWRHALPNSREINAYLMTLPFEEETWMTLLHTTPEEAASNGRGALAHVEHYVREGRKQAQKGVLTFPIPTIPDGSSFTKYYSVKIVNALYMNISELAGALAQEPGIDIGIGYFERGDGVMQFSLRSRSDVDVSAIASSLGGGGHKNAAGFQLPLTQGRALVDRILNRYSEAWYSLPAFK